MAETRRVTPKSGASRGSGGTFGIKIEYVGIIAIVCLFAGAIIGWGIAPKDGARAQTVQTPHSEHMPIDMPPTPQSSEHASSPLDHIAHETDPGALTAIGNDAYDTVFSQRSVAIAAYEKAITLRPNDPDIMTDLAAMYVSAAEPDRAVELARDAARLAPKHPQSRYWLGIALAQTGDTKGAESAFLEVKAIGPSSELAREADKELAKLKSK